MKTSIKNCFTFFCALTLVASCSRKEDKFLNRNFHALNTRYNILYNGDNALVEGKTELNATYTDNYWEVLPIERLEVKDEIKLGNDATNSNFSLAEDKAIKAVQKHGMNIGGREKNPQIDEAYLLLGKARYFDQRFISALEAFNYILYKYPASDKINQARIWREKTNLRLDNPLLTIKNIQRILETSELEGQDLADATATLSQAYIETNDIENAIKELQVATKATKSNEERGRYYFIQGQLYNLLKNKNEANAAFNKVIDLKRKSPRAYYINAFIEIAKNFDYEKEDKTELLNLLSKLEKNPENQPFLDRIYHQKADFYKHTNNDSLAIVYINKSLKTKSLDQQLKTMNYESLGDIYFKNTTYETAQKYYDSTLLNLNENSKNYRINKKKRDNLDEVIYYEKVAHATDSILTLVKLNNTEREGYFKTFIQDLKNKEKDDAERASIISRNKAMKEGQATNGGQTQSIVQEAPTGKSTFYFYNPTTIAYGKLEFTKIWGDRELKDNWRFSNTSSVTTKKENTFKNLDVLANATENEKHDPNFYISKIPSDPKVIDSISNTRNYAYYQLGLIYKDKFNEYQLAKNRLEKLLQLNLEERLGLPVKYNLYKIYELLGEASKANAMQQDITLNYPDSQYAAIIKNPAAGAEYYKNSPEKLYEGVYENYQNQDYAQVVSQCNTYIKQFEGDAMVPKFELLKAYAIGRLKGFDEYSKAISNISVSYANKPEGKEAQNIIKNVLPDMAEKTFESPNASAFTNYKIVYTFTNASQDEINNFTTNLEAVLKTVQNNVKTSKDVYSETTTFVVVHGITNAEVANQINTLLSTNSLTNKPHFIITSKNYEIIQIHKNLDEYLNLKTN